MQKAGGYHFLFQAFHFIQRVINEAREEVNVDFKESKDFVQTLNYKMEI